MTVVAVTGFSTVIHAAGCRPKHCVLSTPAPRAGMHMIAPSTRITGAGCPGTFGSQSRLNKPSGNRHVTLSLGASRTSAATDL